MKYHHGRKAPGEDHRRQVEGKRRGSKNFLGIMEALERSGAFFFVTNLKFDFLLKKCYI